MTRRKSARKDPRQLAAEAAKEWFDSLIASAEGHTHGSIYQVTLESAFDQVEDAVKAEHIKQHGPISEQDQQMYAGMFGRESGYLIGVQVGLRMRSAGGVR